MASENNKLGIPNSLTSDDVGECPASPDPQSVERDDPCCPGLSPSSMTSGTSEPSDFTSAPSDFSSDSESDNDDENDDKSRDSSASSSAPSVDSTQELLRLAHRRIRQEDTYNELNELKDKLESMDQESAAGERQRHALVRRCKEVESQLAAANEKIHFMRQNESRLTDERAVMEVQFMNQLNDCAVEFDRKEQAYMGEIIEKDRRILDLSNKLNQLVMHGRTMDAGQALNQLEVMVAKRVYDDESSDDSSLEYM